MSWLKRGRGNSAPDPVAWVGDGEAGDESDGAPPAATPVPARASSAGAGDAADPDSHEQEHGPWDVSQVSASDAYIDLGGFWLPGRDGLEVELEGEPDTNTYTAVSVRLNDSRVQLQAFAAPRTQGIWDEIRRELAASVTRAGGTADEVPGPFGRELLARVPARGPDGRTVHQPARFAGIDGPRWFLRAVFSGAAAYQAEQAADLEALVRDVVVVRGTEAMAPRELLGLRLPSGMPGAEGEPDEEASDDRDPLQPFERGPEITEVR